MRRIWIVMLSAALGIAFSVPSVTAQTTKAKKEQPAAKKSSQKKARKNTKRQRADTSRVTHAEVAHTLVNLLALSRFLPASPTDQEVFAILSLNNVEPPAGWEAGAVVTKGDLAVLLVKSMAAMGEPVDIDPNDPKAAISWLREHDVPIDTIGQGVSVVGPLAQPVAANVFDPTTDPMVRRERFSSTDETEHGTDAARVTRGVEVAVSQEEVAAVVVPVAVPPRPTTPPTPSQPQFDLGDLLDLIRNR